MPQQDRLPSPSLSASLRIDPQAKPLLCNIADSLHSWARPKVLRGLRTRHPSVMHGIDIDDASAAPVLQAR